MLDLSAPKTPFDIALPYGLSVTVKPLTTAGMAATQAAARRTVEAIERQAHERTEAGLPQDGLPDLAAEAERDGFYQAQPDPRARGPARHGLARCGAGGRTGAADAREHRRRDGALPSG